MSMYTTLLGSALIQRDQTQSAPGIGDLFSQYLRSKGAMSISDTSSPRQAKTLGALTTQLEYDVALIRLVRKLDLVFEIEQFDNGERHRLEQLLIDRGIEVDEWNH